MHPLIHNTIRKIDFSHPNKKIKQLPALLHRMSTLLNEGYTFADSIEMLIPYHTADVAYWRQAVQEKLRNGSNVVDILQSFSVPKHYLIAIQIAEESGKLANALQTISVQLEFNSKMRKKVFNLLSYPILLIIILTSLFFAFRTYFLPNITEIINSRTTNESSSSLSLSLFFLHLPDILFSLCALIICIALLIVIYIRRQGVQMRLNLLLKIPLINYFFKLQLTNQLSKTIGDLLVGGFSLQQAFNILQNQQLNKTLAYVSVELERQVIYGESFSSAVSSLSWFAPKFEEFIKHGEKSGYLGRELLIYCEMLDEKLQSIIKRLVSIVQPVFFVIIALCIIAAYLSILLPMYELIEII